MAFRNDHFNGFKIDFALSNGESTQMEFEANESAEILSIAKHVDAVQRLLGSNVVSIQINAFTIHGFDEPTKKD